MSKPTQIEEWRGQHSINLGVHKISDGAKKFRFDYFIIKTVLYRLPVKEDKFSKRRKKKEAEEPKGVGIPKGVNCFEYCARANIIATGGVDKVIRVWHPHIWSRPTGTQNNVKIEIFAGLKFLLFFENGQFLLELNFAIGKFLLTFE